MTKTRAPISYDNALARIAGLVGWAAMATTTGRAERFADERQLSIFTSTVAREAGEAVAALITASMPGGSERDRTHALREVEELLNAASSTLPLLTPQSPIAKKGKS